MTSLYMLIDVVPDPVASGGTVAVVILFVIGSVILLAAGLVLLLWLRKRRKRFAEMVRPAGSTFNEGRTAP